MRGEILVESGNFMKLHLPLCLATAVLAAYAFVPAFAVESASIVNPPEGYEIKNLNSATTLTQYRTNTSDSHYVMYLDNSSHIDYTYTDWKALDTGSTAFINGGNFFFSTKLPVNNSNLLDTLHFIGSTEIAGSVGKAFSNVGELGFANLSHLEFNGLKDGAIGLAQGGSLTISNIKGDDTYDIEFNKNKAAGCYVIEAGDTGSITMENNGSIRFADNNAFTYDDIPVGTEWWIWDAPPEVKSGGIMCAHTITMNNNEDIVFTSSSELLASGRAIHVIGSNGSLTMKDNGNILISAFADNLAVEVDGTVTILNNKSISIDSNFGGIHARADVIISNTEGAVSFTDNCLLSNKSGQWNGGGIEANNIVMDKNGSVIFSGNSAKSQDNATTYGGAIYVDSSLQISNIVGDVEFSENSAYVQGGAIYSQGDIKFLNNQSDIVFESNKAEVAGGGAIAAVDNINNANVLISGTKGAIMFKGNESCRGGGAIFVPHGNITLSGNMGDITFTQNRSVALENQDSYGAAIRATHGTVTINDNLGTVTFSDNRNLGNDYNNLTKNPNATAALGGAIYANNLEIRNNGDVVFKNNMEIVRPDKSGIEFRMRSLYLDGYASLSAAGEQDITFSDSIYVKGNLNLNSNYKLASGETIVQDGDIIFEASDVQQRLDTFITAYRNELGGTARAAKPDEVDFARTSVIGGLTSVNGGRLRVEKDAIFKSCGILLTAESNATLRIDDAKVVNVATANGAASSILVSSGTTLEAVGHSTIEGGSISFANGAEWRFGLSNRNFYNNAALSFDGMLYMDGGLTVTLDVSNSNMNEHYCLYQGSAAAYENIKNQWTAGNITVNGRNDAAGAGFDDLVWRDGRLYYISSMIWGNNQGTWVWNQEDKNWQNGRIFANGMNVKFTDTAAGEVKLSGMLTPGVVTVVNSENNDYTFTAADEEGRLSHNVDLVKRGSGKLTLNLANDYTGSTSLEEGTLNLHHDKALGDSTLKAAKDTTLGVGNNAHVVLGNTEFSIAGNVEVAEGATLEMKSAGYAAVNSKVDGTLLFTNTAGEVGHLMGNGELKLVNSSVFATGFSSAAALENFHANITVIGGDSALTASSQLWTSGRVDLQGGSLYIQKEGGGDVTVAYGGKVNMASSDTAIATIIARGVIIGSGAELSASQLKAATTYGLNDAQSYVSAEPALLNSAIGGVIHADSLQLESGTTLELNKSHIDLNNNCLHLVMWGTGKINLELTLDGELMKDSSVVLFSGVNMLQLDRAEYTASVSFNAQDYFSGNMIGENTLVEFRDGTVFITGLIPEPSTATLSLLALVALAARRRRK